LASACQFPQEYLKDVLTTAFILGLQDENISRKLLAEKDFTLEKAIATAQSLQVADKEAHEMASQLSSPVQAVNSSHKQTNKSSNNSSPDSHPHQALALPVNPKSTGVHNVLLKMFHA